MMNTPPTADEVMQSNDPAWLRKLADDIEAQAHALAEMCRTRADTIEFRLRMGELSSASMNVNKALGASERRMKELRELDY
jgi:hypothetical protein